MRRVMAAGDVVVLGSAEVAVEVVGAGDADEDPAVARRLDAAGDAGCGHG